MGRRWRYLGLALATAFCVVPPSSTIGIDRPTVDSETREQLTVAASSLVQFRSRALVRKVSHDPERVPTEVMGVAIAPRLARVQERAVRDLENRNRAPVEGGPAYTGARTRLADARAVRAGDHITLDAVEKTEIRHEAGKLVQSVRRRFDFVASGDRIILTGERVLDAEAQPVNDPDPRSR
ncbi:hypothetical protein GCM10010191_82050 [Actinomadura vinacea]|uniref:Organic solvent tolerance-like N-terminal domain-containing protein n=1 Tax=Actinomadura vinacea TaxID=115336 RepID=A0ABN3K8P1_9ACTN